MKKSLLVGGALTASLVLAACGGGSSPSSNNTTTSTNGSTTGSGSSIAALLSTITAQPTVQLHVTGSGTGFDSTKDEGIAKDVSVDVNVASTSGGSIASSSGSVNTEVFINIGTGHLLDVRVIGSNLYVLLDASALSGVSGVNLSAGDLALVNATFGGKWYEVPESLISSKLPKSSQGASSSADVGDAMKLASAFESAVEGASSTSLPGGGFSITGTLQSLASAIDPDVQAIDPTASAPTNVKGTYAFTITASNSVATGMTASVTAPNEGANATVALTIGIAHDGSSITAPSSSTEVTPQLIQELEGSSGGL